MTNPLPLARHIKLGGPTLSRPCDFGLVDSRPTVAVREPISTGAGGGARFAFQFAFVATCHACATGRDLNTRRIPTK